MDYGIYYWLKIKNDLWIYSKVLEDILGFLWLVFKYIFVNFLYLVLVYFSVLSYIYCEV